MRHLGASSGAAGPAGRRAPAASGRLQQQGCARPPPRPRRRAPAAAAQPQPSAPAAAAAAGRPQQQAPPPAYLEDSATAAFLAWARGAGASFERLRPASFAGLRGLAAAAPIKADDLILSVPRGAAITLPPKQRCPCPEFVTPAFWDAAPWFVRLGVRLLAERAKGPSSGLAPYLQQLPKAVDTPVSWSGERLQQLQYPYLIQKVTEQQQEWAALHEGLCAGMAPGVPPPSRADFFWALACVRSRTFSGPYVASTLSDRLRLAGLVAFLVVGNTLAQGPDSLANSAGAAVAAFVFNILYETILSGKLKQYALCPVIDLANHSSSETAEVSYDYFRDAFVVAAGRDYAPGSQVFVSYGTQSNDSLMQYYGFAEPSNPADSYVMVSLLKWLEQLAQPSQARLGELNGAGLLPALQEVAVTRQGFAPRTLQALRFLLAPDGAPGGPAAFEAPGGAALEERVGLVLVHACRQELAALGTSLEEDLALAAAGPGGGGGGGGAGRRGGARRDGGAADAAAVAFRIEKKRVLAECLRQLTGGSG
ncbi:hypothetical protein Rsub_01289 [Raphidocelis subcapitata]|uniref:SET domain-containing protein n=1 Tax=Raphidocelis subcapitata TaxID=307507 RepID=A0A2V0NM77_9CHLO|nr:hypothetical protein Rsub_01289 [Raphidocelis subcapitata]|eukprot:GBF88574.1 hypothetical protein Rsub_01289 [Raphidocelis subcapitata]